MKAILKMPAEVTCTRHEVTRRADAVGDAGCTDDTLVALDSAFIRESPKLRLIKSDKNHKIAAKTMKSRDKIADKTGLDRISRDKSAYVGLTELFFIRSGTIWRTGSPRIVKLRWNFLGHLNHVITSISNARCFGKGESHSIKPNQTSFTLCGSRTKVLTSPNRWNPTQSHQIKVNQTLLRTGLSSNWFHVEICLP